MSDSLVLNNHTTAINLDALNAYLGTLFSLFGLFVSVYTLIRVQRINRAKKEEREVLTRSLNLRELLDNLRITESSLKNKQVIDVDQVRFSLNRLNTELETSLRILIPEALERKALTNISVLPGNYWTDTFATESIDKATFSLVVIAWRSTRCFTEEKLSKYIDKISDNKDIIIKIFFISPEAPELVFETLDKMLEIGNATQIRVQQRDSKAFAIETLVANAIGKKISQEDLNRLELYEYTLPPLIHCVIVDDEVNWGINFFMDPKIGATKLLSQASLAARKDSSFGIKVIEQVTILEKFSSRINLTLSSDHNEP